MEDSPHNGDRLGLGGLNQGGVDGVGSRGLRWLPVTSPHGNFATVTSPQKLCHMVTSPHFEKVRGDVGIVGKCVGVWEEMWEEV